MALGIVSEDDFDKEVEKLLPLNTPVVKDIEKGRGNVLEKPDSLRTIVGEEAINGTPAKELARAFNISESSVSAYKNGSTSTSSYNEPNRQLKKHIDIFRDRITRKASRKLVSALDAMDDLSEVKPRDAAGIAKDLSVVIKNMQPEVVQNAQQNNIQFVIHAPKLKNEDDFDVINANE